MKKLAVSIITFAVFEFLLIFILIVSYTVQLVDSSALYTVVWELIRALGAEFAVKLLLNLLYQSIALLGIGIFLYTYTKSMTKK